MSRKAKAVPKTEVIVISGISDDRREWLNKSQKELKMNSLSELVRTLLDYIRANNDISTLRANMEKTRLQILLQEAESKAEQANKEKEKYEKELEKLNA